LIDNLVSEQENGWLRVQVPLPYSLKWVNAYLLPGEGEDDWSLIDPGLHTEEATDVWQAVMRDRGIEWGQIARIVLTHHHPDHYGLAGWFQERSGAPVWMSRKAHETAHWMWGRDGEGSEGIEGSEGNGRSVTEALLASFLAHGLPASLADGMKAHLLGFVARVSPQPAAVSYLHPNAEFRMAGVRWELIGGEGHAPGHVSFYDPNSGRLLCGDQVLPDISPNIGWLPGGDPDPLGSFLDSLRAMRSLEVTCAYPGHRQPFGRFRERVDELADHHERRLERIAELIRERPSASFDVCERLFGERLRGNIHNLRFALSETIAHLVLLERRGVLRLADNMTWVSRLP